MLGKASRTTTRISVSIDYIAIFVNWLLPIDDMRNVVLQFTYTQTTTCIAFCVIPYFAPRPIAIITSHGFISTCSRSYLITST